MNYEHYKAASEATDADERALIPGFKRIRPTTKEDAERENDLRQESRDVEEREASGYWDNYEGDQ